MNFCVVIVQAGYTPRAWLPSDLASNLALGVLLTYPEFHKTNPHKSN